MNPPQVYVVRLRFSSQHRDVGSILEILQACVVRLRFSSQHRGVGIGLVRSI